MNDDVNEDKSNNNSNNNDNINNVNNVNNNCNSISTPPLPSPPPPAKKGFRFNIPKASVVNKTSNTIQSANAVLKNIDIEQPTPPPPSPQNKQSSSSSSSISINYKSSTTTTTTTTSYDFNPPDFNNDYEYYNNNEAYNSSNMSFKSSHISHLFKSNSTTINTNVNTSSSSSPLSKSPTLKPSFPIKPSLPINKSNATTNTAIENKPLTISALKPSLPQKPNTTTTTTTTTSSNTQPLYNNKTIYVNEVQKGNPLIRNFSNNITVEYIKNQVPDYVINVNICVFFLSLKVYRLKPNYVVDRIKGTPQSFELRVLLVLVDVDDCVALLEELNIAAIKSNLTLIVCWSHIEAAKYIETYKNFSSSNKSVDFIKARQQPVELGGKTKKEQVLTSIRSINKTDANTLVSNFKNMQAVFTCSKGTLLKCPGFGPVKAQNFYNTIHQPFKSKKSNISSSNNNNNNNSKDNSNSSNNNSNKNNSNSNDDQLYSDTRLNLETLKENSKNKNNDHFIDELSFDFGSEGEEDEEDFNNNNSNISNNSSN